MKPNRHNQPPFRVTIFCAYGTPNIGDKAIALTLIDILRKSTENFEITILTYPSSNSHAQYEDKLTGCRIIRSGVFRNITQTIRQIRKSNLLVIGGGGLIQDSSSFGNLIFQLSRPLIASIFGTPFVGCGLGIGPLRNSASIKITRLILKRAKFLCVRDKESAMLLRKLGIEKNKIHECADIVLASPEILSYPLNQHQTHVFDIKQKAKPYAIGISIRPECGHHKPNSSPTPFFKQLLEDVISLVDTLHKNENIYIHFISMHAIQDDAIGYEIKSRIQQPDKFNVISGKNTPRDIMKNVRSLDLMIGMRLHSLIFASISNIPFIGLDYDPKIKEFCSLIGLPQLSIPLNTFNSNNLIPTIDYVMKHTDNITLHLQSKRDQLMRMAINNVEILEKYVINNKKS